MKKNIIIALAACVALAACTKNELKPVEVDQQITFQAVVNKPSTKAMLTGTSYPTGSTFGTVAYKVKGDNSELYIPVSEVKYYNTSSPAYWSTEAPYYWPKESGSSLTFYSYSPFNYSETGTKTAIPVTAAATGLTFENYSVKDHQQTDLMVADKKDNQTSNTTTTNSWAAGVPTVFHHMLAQIVEILLNEAEAKAELGEMDGKVWDNTIRPLRERAGVNGDAPTVADPYLVKYYLGKCSDKWLLEIRRERAIELFFEGEGLRYDDLMRWGEGEMLAGEWNSIYIGEKNKAYDTNGDGVKDLEVCDGKPASTVSGIYYINLAKSPYYSFKDGRLYIKNENDWSDKKYLHPIPRAALVKNPNLKQNYGWK